MGCSSSSHGIGREWETYNERIIEMMRFRMPYPVVTIICDYSRERKDFHNNVLASMGSISGSGNTIRSDFYILADMDKQNILTIRIFGIKSYVFGIFYGTFEISENVSDIATALKGKPYSELLTSIPDCELSSSDLDALTTRIQIEYYNAACRRFGIDIPIRFVSEYTAHGKWKHWKK
jgi:hypothetical protein